VRKNYLIMAVVALMAGSGGYFFAMITEPASRPSLAPMDVDPGPAVEDLVGQRRPDFTLFDTLGTPVSASDFDGHVWLANFWATWCTPCVEEMPMLSSLQQDYADQGVKIVGIALDDARRASEFAAGLGISYRVLVGSTDVVITGRQFGNATGMLPFSVLIDAAGNIRWTRLGALSGEELEAQIQLLLDR
jgi:thiol-disulfide isomerase/thioredoxin